MLTSAFVVPFAFAEWLLFVVDPLSFVVYSVYKCEAGCDVSCDIACTTASSMCAPY